MKNFKSRGLALTGLAVATMLCSGGAFAAPASQSSIASIRVMSQTQKGKVPHALFDVSEDSEDLYDQAYAANWSRANTAVTKIGRDAAMLTRTQPQLGARAARLQSLVIAAKRQIAAKDRPAALRDINQMTRLTIEMGAAYPQPIPTPVSLLDYYGRELQVWSIAGDKARLRSTLSALEATWKSVRPQVVARRGGANAARRFDALVSRARAAKTPGAVLPVAAPILDEVDKLENVFA